jgi:dihydrofolate reductase
MRRVIEATLMSLDGVVGEPHAWAGEYFDDRAREAALAELLACDAMLMGRGTYSTFARTWPSQGGDYADRLNSMPKSVFSSTLDTAAWSNTTVIRGDAVAAVAKLKEQAGRDLIVYGHGRLAQTLLEHKLLNELRFFVHPLVVGRGMVLFRDGARARLTLTASQALPTGVVALTYRPVPT